MNNSRALISASSLTNSSWSNAWASLAFRWRLALVLLLIFGGLVPTVPLFYHFIQQRPGWYLSDPLLPLLPRHDEATAIFTLMYGASIATIGFVLRRPGLLLRGFWAYFFLQVIRMLVLWLTPLEPPLNALPLPDPFMDNIFHTQAAPITKDLFFSGHTATATLLALAVRGRWWRSILGLIAAAVGVLVLVQHVHYSYDVLAAPLFARLAYWLAGQLATKPNDEAIGQR